MIIIQTGREGNGFLVGSFLPINLDNLAKSPPGYQCEERSDEAISYNQLVTNEEIA